MGKSRRVKRCILFRFTEILAFRPVEQGSIAVFVLLRALKRPNLGFVHKYIDENYIRICCRAYTFRALLLHQTKVVIHIKNQTVILLLASALFITCKNETQAPQMGVPSEEKTARPDTSPLSAPAADSIIKPKTKAKPAKEEAPSSAPPPVESKSLPQGRSLPQASHNEAANFSNLGELEPSILLDIRYATANNFTKAKIYDCPACLLRPEAAQAIVKVQKALKKKGLGLKMFDCYRPRPYQQRLWDKVPDPNYVMPPAKGSMHSRGAAVDLTLVDAKGNELDMGTTYDFFGVEAHTDYTKLPAKVLDNRRILREAMEAAGFKGIRTEWWHFSYQRKQYGLSDYVWPCGY